MARRRESSGTENETNSGATKQRSGPVQSDALSSDHRVQVVMAQAGEDKERRRVFTEKDVRGLMNKVGVASVDNLRCRAERDRLLAAGDFEGAARVNARAVTALDKRFDAEHAMIEAKGAA